MTQPHGNITLEAENEDYVDNDSALGSFQGSSTTSITSSILKHREENGRTYHSYAKEKNYVLPNDESENDRLDLQHHLFNLTLDNRLFTCKGKGFQRVLDVGTGTGIWALDFADEFPEAHVIGVDLSPTQPSFVAPNVEFQIDDVEEDWTYSLKFDFIHARLMTGSISDWPKFFRQCFDNLNPGGYIEITDLTFPIESDDDSLPSDSALVKWSGYMLEASKNFNRPLDTANGYIPQVEEAGFTDIEQSLYKWPQNRWPKDPKFKELGMWTLADVAGNLEGLSLVYFTHGLKWTVPELDVFLVDVRNDMKNTKFHGYWPILNLVARKPL